MQRCWRCRSWTTRSRKAEARVGVRHRSRVAGCAGGGGGTGAGGGATKLAELRAEHSGCRSNASRSRKAAASEERMTRVRNEREEAAVKVGDRSGAAARWTRTEADLEAGLGAGDADGPEAGRAAEGTIERVVPRSPNARGTDGAARGKPRRSWRSAADRARMRQSASTSPAAACTSGCAKGKSRLSLAPLTDEGACGNCFNILPVQEQAEVRRGESLHRCEGCGVILYAA
jgi:hypothetical protein